MSSGLTLKTDVAQSARHVAVGPCVDGSGLARRIFTLQRWSEQPCVRPVCAVLMTAGHNALRGSGPGHVWTAPGWQEEFSLCSDGRSSHVFGLFVRYS